MNKLLPAKILKTTSFDKYYYISDIHGDLKAFKYALNSQSLLDESREKVKLQSNTCVVINGDTFDFYWDKTIGLNEHIQYLNNLETKNWVNNLLDLFNVTDYHIRYHFENIFTYNSIVFKLLENRLSNEKIALESIASLKTLETLYFIAQQRKKNANLIIIKGNHDFDYLSGLWEYRSLQKNLIYSIVNNNFTLKYLELKEKKNGLEPVLYNFNSTDEYYKTILQGIVGDVFNDSYSALLTEESLIVHGGIPNQMLSELLNLQEVDIKKFEAILAKYTLSRDGLNTVFSSDEVIDLPTSNLDEISALLSKLNKKRLIVGHNPFLGYPSIGKIDVVNDLNARNYVFSVSKVGDTIVKLDSGIKFGNSEPGMFIEINPQRMQVL